MQKPNLRIIIIDDNPEIHKDFIKILTCPETEENAQFKKLDSQIFGDTQEDTLALPCFQIDSASQGQEGVQQIEKALKEGNPYALAFVDIRMPPGWDGIETIKHIWQLDKNIQVVICTAYSDYTWEETISELGQTDNLLILKKPFDHIAVRQLACALTRKWQLMNQTRDHLTSLEAKIKERTLDLEKALSRTRATLESSTDGILVIDNEKNIVDYNKKFLEMWKIPSAILDSNNFDILLEYMNNQLTDSDSNLAVAKNLLANPEKISVRELSFKNNKIYECYSQPHQLMNKTVGRVWSYRDITQRIQLEQKLQYQATHDDLTGLLNRLTIMEKIYEALTKREKVALFFIDLDRFKLINDSLGHAAGDEIIKEFAFRLGALLDANHIAARLGGDEFILLVKGTDNQEKLAALGKRILAIMERPIKIGNREVFITASLGISIAPKDCHTADDLLHYADAAMYHAKELGANEIQFYSEDFNRKALQRLELESDLRRGIAAKQFFLLYQPEIDVYSEKIVAVEALVRWNHPIKGVILPLDFIPLAEETNLIVPLGEWILRAACEQNKKWQDQGLPPIKIAVNVTAQQFKHPGFVTTVSNILKETELDPSFLKLEVTENTIISDPIVINTITELKKLGLSIVLDDFGTGNSSLIYLRKIPLDGLKIDRSFIQNIQLNRGDEVLIRAIIAMAHNLNLQILAEGVESTNQLGFLKSHHCEEVQGFYFSKPVPPNEIISLLSTTGAAATEETES